MGILQRAKQWLSGPVNTAPRYNGSFSATGVLPSITPSREPVHMNSAVMSVINWTATQLGQLSIEAYTYSKNTYQDQVAMFPALQEAYNNSYRNGRDFAVALSLLTEGTAFLYKVRSPGGRILGLQYLYHADCSFDGQNVRYKEPDGKLVPIEREQLVILKYGQDPRDSRRGMSPLKSCIREVLTDQEASEYMRAVLKNFGVVGGVLSPDDETMFPPQDLQLVAQAVRESTTGGNRGRMVVLPKRMRFTPIATSPQSLMIDSLRTIPEQRIAAVFNIPAVVLGFGAGLDASTYNNVKMMVRLAWDQFMLPFANAIAAQLTVQLLPELTNNATLRVGFDTRNVEALAEDYDELATRMEKLLAGNVITVNEARVALDFAPADGMDLFAFQLQGAQERAQQLSALSESIARRARSEI